MNNLTDVFPHSNTAHAIELSIYTPQYHSMQNSRINLLIIESNRFKNNNNNNNNPPLLTECHMYSKNCCCPCQSISTLSLWICGTETQLLAETTLDTFFRLTSNSTFIKGKFMFNTHYNLKPGFPMIDLYCTYSAVQV